ncbi:helix-turn-helix domain-containing protein [Novosphingobium decolorationis]|uniref:Plasmid replication protein C N-terminal domain-containing protein n=1 Tax=Novosphingobium decolorationis TaxID=2698673 RepID=A0ABX8E5S7_9SPHN|nr:helix-turn-helix domain-containing protein [Novosphingobium decolorationis]QVM84537.1 hypothetical protein HT578_13315 [Novosphingobium decolorationis]
MTGVTQKHGGLHAAISGKWALIDLIREVGRDGLKLNARQIRYLELCIKWCRDGDFRRGAICAHWNSVDAVAGELGCSPRQVWNIETSLEQAGLIQRTFGKNGRRCAKRDSSGQIAWAAGINLSPMLTQEKQAYLLDLQKELSEERAALEILRAEIQLVRRRIQVCGDTGAIRKMDAILPGGRTSRLRDRPHLEELLAALQSVRTAISAACGATKISDEDAKTADASEISGAPYTPLKHSKNLRTPPAASEAARVTPRQAMLLASASYRMRVEALGGASAANLVEASAQVCSELGIGPAGWGSICQRLGREAAALAILVIHRNARLPQDDPYHARDPARCAFGLAKRLGGVNLQGMLMAGLRMDLDRELPRQFARPEPTEERRYSAEELTASFLANFQLEVLP